VLQASQLTALLHAGVVSFILFRPLANRLAIESLDATVRAVPGEYRLKNLREYIFPVFQVTKLQYEFVEGKMGIAAL
jgi:hypothetical protein